MRKIIFTFTAFGLLLLIWIAYRAYTAPVYQKINAAPINPSIDPIQTLVPGAPTIPILFPEGEAQLTLLAEYRIAARICGKQGYSTPWASYVAPYDLCLAWGKLASDEIKGKVEFLQDTRWYTFRVEKHAPVDIAYVSSHSANTHVIHANDNLLKAVSRLNVGDIVEMNGYLVNVEGKYKGGKIWWRTSTRRDDTGGGSCEVFYLTSLRLGDRLYGTPQ